MEKAQDIVFLCLLIYIFWLTPKYTVDDNFNGAPKIQVNCDVSVDVHIMRNMVTEI